MKIFARGRLLNRIEKNFLRLEGDFYQPDEMFADKNSAWPGDWTGRTLLAFAWHEKTLGRRHRFMDEYLRRLPSVLNEYLYFGAPLKETHVNEQGIAGNSWFLRAMCLRWRESGDADALRIVRTASRHIASVLDKTIACYPVRRESLIFGKEAGEIVLSGGCWQMSSDIGCVYIGLDGLTDAYEITRDEIVGQALRKMIEHFAVTDLLENHFQTHASLSATRGILRFYRVTGETKYLELARKVFELYLKEGMTLNFANINWFGYGDWTEPCAIVDSFLVADQLFRITEEYVYLRTAQRILYNALLFAQRENGGFGCDNCVVPGQPRLSVRESSYEAYWCCSMRGAEGLGYLNFATSEETPGGARIFYLNPAEISVHGGALCFEIAGDFPFGDAVIRFENSRKDTTLDIETVLPVRELHVKGCGARVEENRIVLENLSKGEVRISFDAKTERTELVGGICYDHGLLRLCLPEAEQDYDYADYITYFDGKKLMNIPDGLRIPTETALEQKFRVLF